VTFKGARLLYAKTLLEKSRPEEALDQLKSNAEADSECGESRADNLEQQLKLFFDTN